MNTYPDATPAELSAVLESSGLLDFPTLRLGWDNGWIDRESVVAAAVQRLVADADEADDDLVALAAADDADDEMVDELLARLADAGPGLPAEEARRRWWLAHLEVLASRRCSPEELVEQAEQLWARLGYPPELGRLSPYDTEPLSDDGRPPDPAVAPQDLLASLRRELGLSQ